MLGFKDLFLVGFFLTIGMSGELTLTSVIIGLALVPLIIIKSALFLKVMCALKLRARTSLIATLNLSNYSEFGLIVIAIGVANQWLDGQWLIVMAIALSVSFVFAAPLNKADNNLYRKHRDKLKAMEHTKRLPDDLHIDTRGAKVAVFGMGRVGTGAYNQFSEIHDKHVIGIDFDNKLIQKHLDERRNVVMGDPSDPDFWEKIEHNPPFELILLALPNLQANLSTVAQLKQTAPTAKIAAIVGYPDEEETLLAEGVTAVYNIYGDSGSGFAEHVFNTVYTDVDD